MTLDPGSKLGPYEIVASLGSGGIGEVYRARDTRLGRVVAVKVLHLHLCASAEAKHRFEREARTISSLNHPNICHLYDVGEQEGINYFVMEYLQGETLAQRLQKGAMPLKCTIKIALAVADAMDVAHNNGVIHRDFKPSNVLITQRDEVKILDFGLAKSTVVGGSGEAIDADEITLSSDFQLTEPGAAVGTIAYMSPEQARGEKVDVRTDLFSIGVVLYEMTTGRRPFVGPTAAVIFDAILNRQPLAPSVLNAAVASSLERTIMRLLAKDRSARLQTAHELLDELHRVLLDSENHDQHTSAICAASIVVLPFEDLSPDRSQQPFCEGMAAEIISALGNVEGLRVISRTSAVRCRDKGMDISEIGQHLNVQRVLEGTVRKSGARLRVTAQLVNSCDGTQVWSQRYDRGEGDIFDIQEEIATAIVRNLKGRLVGSQTPAIKRTTHSVEAYKLYLKGRYFWERRNRTALQNAVTYFEQAIATDPDYALAHAGLADCHTIMGIYSIRPTHEVYPRALNLAKRALELDPDLAEAYSSLGAVKHFLEWEWDGAITCYTRALELDPRIAIARIWRATVLIATNRRPEEAIADSIAAIKLEPDSGLIAYIAAINHYWGRDPDSAATLIERALELEPKAIFAHWVRALIFSIKGLHEESISATLRAVSIANHHPLLVSALGAAYARAGHTAEAEELIAELCSRSGREYIAPQYIAEIYLALDRTAEACEWFEHAVDESNPLFLGAAVAQQYDPLRNEPRFRALLRRMNLASGRTDIGFG
jgi:serine/threonine protein kinase/tetratricopeptide (TPR) repeat protein